MKRMNFIVTHMYREGDSCVDGLANIGLNLSNFIWWHEAPDPIRSELARNVLGMSNYRFVIF